IRNGIMVPISDNQINNVLPSRSDKKPKMSKPTINPAIVMDKDRLDVDTETPNVSTNTGSNGLTAYIDAKTKKEASARLNENFQNIKSLIGSGCFNIIPLDHSTITTSLLSYYNIT